MSMSVRERAYLQNYMSDLPQIFVHVFVHVISVLGRLLAALRYAMYVRFYGSCKYTMAGNGRRNSNSLGTSIDLSQWRILKLTHQGGAPYRGPSLLSTIALLLCPQ